MILHLGAEASCFSEDVLFVLKSDITAHNPDTARWLSHMQCERIGGQGQAVKSYVAVQAPGGKVRVYASLLSAETMQRRAKEMER